jgi:hypothetical protein
MNYAKWNEHVQDCLYARLYDTEDYANVEERGLPGVYYDVVWDELHDDVRLTTIDEMVAMDMRGGNLGEQYYSEMREVLEDCGIDTTSWTNGYVCERYRLLMSRTIRQMAEDECIVGGYGGYSTDELTIRYD